MRTSVVASTVLVLVSSTCGPSPADPSVNPETRACADAAEDIAELLVTVADRAAQSGVGLATPAVERPDGASKWDLMARLADGSADLEAQVAAARADLERRSCETADVHATVEMRVEQELSERAENLQGEELDLDEYTAVTFMSLMAAEFRSPPSGHDVPVGIPAEFPVHPMAADGKSDLAADGTTTATWQIVGEDYQAVADYYLDALQEGRSGGWDVSRSEGSSTVGVDGQAISGRQILQITGYGYAGEVEVDSQDDERVIITARLVPNDSPSEHRETTG